MPRFNGTEGYAEQAGALLDRYERRAFEDVHAAILPLIPASGPVLDIGAGTGRDAAALAERGLDVLAVEPTAELREPAARLHPSARITWLDDGLPDLARVIALDQRFTLVMATAVWMHLDAAERTRAMAVIGPLVMRGGILSLTLRRGPVPGGRRMFHVTAAETIALAAKQGLRCIVDREEPSTGEDNRAVGVRWARVAFVRDVKAGRLSSVDSSSTGPSLSVPYSRIAAMILPASGRAK